jgi:hypothetical protein
MCLEELGCASIKADTLALVEFTFSVIGRNALQRADLDHA